MTIEQLYHVVTIAEFMNFSKAANALHISQSALSLSIRRLEAELQLPLFIRNTRTVSLTTAGTVFCKHAHTVLSAYEALKKEMNSIESSRPELRIGLISSAKARGILPHILDFVSLVPQYSVSIGYDSARGLLNKLQKQEIDVAILPIFPTFTTPISTPLSMTYLFSEERYVIMPSTNPLCQKRTLTRDDLKDQPFVIYERDTSSISEELDFSNQLGFSIHCALKTRDFDVAISSVHQNIGIRIETQSIAQHYGLETRPIVPSFPSTHFFLIYPIAYESNPLMPKLKDHLLSRYVPNPETTISLNSQLSHWKNG